MSIKSLFNYTLFLTLGLGIGAVTNAKALLIEQAPQEAAQIEALAYLNAIRNKRNRMRPRFSQASNH